MEETSLSGCSEPKTSVFESAHSSISHPLTHPLLYSLADVYRAPVCLTPPAADVLSDDGGFVGASSARALSEDVVAANAVDQAAAALYAAAAPNPIPRKLLKALQKLLRLIDKAMLAWQAQQEKPMLKALHAFTNGLREEAEQLDEESSRFLRNVQRAATEEMPPRRLRMLLFFLLRCIAQSILNRPMFLAEPARATTAGIVPAEIEGHSASSNSCSDEPPFAPTGYCTPSGEFVTAGGEQSNRHPVERGEKLLSFFEQMQLFSLAVHAKEEKKQIKKCSPLPSLTLVPTAVTVDDAATAASPPSGVRTPTSATGSATSSLFVRAASTPSIDVGSGTFASLSPAEAAAACGVELKAASLRRFFSYAPACFESKSIVLNMLYAFLIDVKLHHVCGPAALSEFFCMLHCKLDCMRLVVLAAFRRVAAAVDRANAAALFMAASTGVAGLSLHAQKHLRKNEGKEAQAEEDSDEPADQVEAAASAVAAAALVECWSHVLRLFLSSYLHLKIQRIPSNNGANSEHVLEQKKQSDQTLKQSEDSLKQSRSQTSVNNESGKKVHEVEDGKLVYVQQSREENEVLSFIDKKKQNLFSVNFADLAAVVLSCADLSPHFLQHMILLFLCESSLSNTAPNTQAHLQSASSCRFQRPVITAAETANFEKLKEVLKCLKDYLRFYTIAVSSKSSSHAQVVEKLCEIDRESRNDLFLESSSTSPRSASKSFFSSTDSLQHMRSYLSDSAVYGLLPFSTLSFLTSRTAEKVLKATATAAPLPVIFACCWCSRLRCSPCPYYCICSLTMATLRASKQLTTAWSCSCFQCSALLQVQKDACSSNIKDSAFSMLQKQQQRAQDAFYSRRLFSLRRLAQPLLNGSFWMLHQVLQLCSTLSSSATPASNNVGSNNLENSRKVSIGTCLFPGAETLKKVKGALSTEVFEGISETGSVLNKGPAAGSNFDSDAEAAKTDAAAFCGQRWDVKEAVRRCLRCCERIECFMTHFRQFILKQRPHSGCLFEWTTLLARGSGCAEVLLSISLSTTTNEQRKRPSKYRKELKEVNVAESWPKVALTAAALLESEQQKAAVIQRSEVDAEQWTTAAGAGLPYTLASFFADMERNEDFFNDALISILNNRYGATYLLYRLPFSLAKKALRWLLLRKPLDAKSRWPLYVLFAVLEAACEKQQKQLANSNNKGKETLSQLDDDSWIQTAKRLLVSAQGSSLLQPVPEGLETFLQEPEYGLSFQGLADLYRPLPLLLRLYNELLVAAAQSGAATLQRLFFLGLARVLAKNGGVHLRNSSCMQQQQQQRLRVGWFPAAALEDNLLLDCLAALLQASCSHFSDALALEFPLDNIGERDVVVEQILRVVDITLQMDSSMFFSSQTHATVGGAGAATAAISATKFSPFARLLARQRLRHAARLLPPLVLAEALPSDIYIKFWSLVLLVDASVYIQLRAASGFSMKKYEIAGNKNNSDSEYLSQDDEELSAKEEEHFLYFSEDESEQLKKQQLLQQPQQKGLLGDKHQFQQLQQNSGNYGLLMDTLLFELLKVYGPSLCALGSADTAPDAAFFEAVKTAQNRIETAAAVAAQKSKKKQQKVAVDFEEEAETAGAAVSSTVEEGVTYEGKNTDQHSRLKAPAEKEQDSAVPGGRVLEALEKSKKGAVSSVGEETMQKTSSLHDKQKKESLAQAAGEREKNLILGGDRSNRKRKIHFPSNAAAARAPGFVINGPQQPPLDLASLVLLMFSFYLEEQERLIQAVHQ